MPITTTMTPTAALRGNPVSDTYQPNARDVEDLFNDIISNGAAASDLTALDARVTTVETDKAANTVTDALDARLDAVEAAQASGGINRNPVAAWAASNITLSGSQTVDGVTLTNGDRVGVGGQTAPEENGVYAYNDSGAWTRVTDMDADAEINLSTVFVDGGTTHGGRSYRFSVADTSTFTLDTDAITATQVGDAGAVQDQIDAVQTETDKIQQSPAASKVPEARALGWLNPQWVGQSVPGMQAHLARYPDNTDADMIADFGRNAYRTRDGGQLILGDRGDVLHVQRWEEDDSLGRDGLTYSSAATKNKCLAGLNDPHLDGWANDGGIITVVEVADLPAGPRAYFQGILGGEVKRVFVADNSGGGSTVNCTTASAGMNTSEHTASVYAMAVGADGQLGVQNGGLTDIVADAAGARTETTVSSPSATDGLRIRAKAGATVYFAAPQLEEAASATAYTEAALIRNRVEPVDMTFVSFPALITCEFFSTSVSGSNNPVFTAFDPDADIYINARIIWASSILYVEVTDGTDNNAVSLPLAYSPDAPMILAVHIDASGGITASMNGGVEKADATNTFTMTGIDRLFCGCNSNPGSGVQPIDFLDGSIRHFSFEGL